jgi:hypothetical protein
MVKAVEAEERDVVDWINLKTLFPVLTAWRKTEQGQC